MKTKIIAVLRRRDEIGMHAIGRALVHLYNRQTADEQAVEETMYRNNRGFTGADARKGAGMAKFYMKAGFLTPKQVAYWQSDRDGKLKRPRIEKYWRQLTEEAVKKQATA